MSGVSQMFPNLIVRKYGGVCLSTPERIRSIALEIAELRSQHHPVIVAVSAMGQTTNELIQLAQQVSARPARRELDMLLTTGERISMALLTMALRDLGISAISYTGSQAGILTDRWHNNAHIIQLKPIRVEESLSKGEVVVLAGFQGVDHQTKEITTLGRGGTDTTAVAFAAHFRAERCEMIKEVDGLCSGDPRLVPNTRTLFDVTYFELMEMCFWGAKVLHYRSTELAWHNQVPLSIKKWQSDVVTHIQKERAVETFQILSVNSHPLVEHAHIKSESLADGLQKLSQHLQDHELPMPQILAATYEAPSTRVMMTGDQELLAAIRASTAQDLTLSQPTATVTVTATALFSPSQIARLTQLLRENGVAIHKAFTSSHSITFNISTMQRELALNLLHAQILEPAGLAL